VKKRKNNNMSEIKVENGLRFLAAISRDHLREFIDLVHAHMGPAAEPQLLVHADATPAEGIFLNKFNKGEL
jgi:hypothetical protein